jgi:hypothetical protein
MAFSSWLRNWKPTFMRERRSARKQATFRPALEVLEDRYVPSVSSITGGFSSIGSYPVGTAPQAVVTADVNGDGKLDLITANEGSFDATTGTSQGAGVSVLLGASSTTTTPGKKGSTTTTTSTFAPANNYAVGPAYSLAVGDLNGDGKLDIVTDGGGVLLGNGDGTFHIGPKCAGGMVALADVNGDGKLDFITAGYVAINVFLGNGDGTFRAGSTTTGADGLAAVAVGDFNRDGKLDLFTAANGDGAVKWLPGNGDGSFAAARTIALGGDFGPMAVGDFNADGNLDVAFTFYGNNSADTQVFGTILLGNGDGTVKEFAGDFAFNVGAASVPLLGLVVADFNHDGKPDLITVSDQANPSMHVLLGSGNGYFGTEQDFYLQLHLSNIPQSSASLGLSFAVGDFNGDGFLDVAVAGINYSTGGSEVEVSLWSPASTSTKKK